LKCEGGFRKVSIIGEIIEKVFSGGALLFRIRGLQFKGKCKKKHLFAFLVALLLKLK